MAYAISYTLKHYSLFVGGTFPFMNFNHFNFFANKEYTLAKLKKVSSEIFKDIDKRLVRDLIDFFNLIPEGGNIIVKHYNFELIWEDMVEKYLNTFFVKVTEEGLVFADEKVKNPLQFKKKVFHVDKAHPKNSLEPDHYVKENDKINI